MDFVGNIDFDSYFQIKWFKSGLNLNEGSAILRKNPAWAGLFYIADDRIRLQRFSLTNCLF